MQETTFLGAHQRRTVNKFSCSNASTCHIQFIRTTISQLAWTESKTDAKQRFLTKDKLLPVDVRDAVEEISSSLDAHDSDME